MKRALAAIALLLAALRLWPHAPLADRVPLSTAVWSADGELLRVTLAADDQYRLWTPLSEISPVIADAFLLKEDRWFYWHPGVNPAALVRAGVQTWRGAARQGGSTISMQVARMIYRLNTRTVGGKLRQIATALWLEARYSKHALLEAYLNLAPFGGNIQGVGAASRIFFGKPPDRVTLGEAVTLAVIPQSPSARAGGGLRPQSPSAPSGGLRLQSSSAPTGDGLQPQSPSAPSTGGLQPQSPSARADGGLQLQSPSAPTAGGHQAQSPSATGGGGLQPQSPSAPTADGLQPQSPPARADGGLQPQSPSARAGGGLQQQKLLKARAQLAALWLARRGGDPAERRQLEWPVAAAREFPMPWLAPHFVDALLVAPPVRSPRIETTLDLGLQRLAERQVQRYLDEYGDRGIRNASVLLLDSRDMSVQAWVGSADYWNRAIDGQVDGVLAKRSPGSALKPFIYALALDQGVLHPRTILRDAPTSFGPFTPENFDGRFFGPLPAEDALVRSRNVPAMWVSMQLRQPSLYGFLQSAGVSRLKPESYYGLALALGGGEVTMEELAGLYGMLANQGVLRPIRATPLPRSRRPDDGTRMLSPEASFITLDMLRRNPRPDDDGAPPRRSRWPIAWKTGTSWGFRDAWSAGIVGRYVLVVWIGNFSGAGNPSFVGIDAAAPLFFRIADALNLARAKEPPPALQPPAGVSKVAVCAASGDLPNAWCPQTVETWYIPGKSPIRVSELHRAVAIDAATGRPACPPYSPASTRFEVYEFWSSDMLKLFREAGMPRRAPPPLPACTAENGADAPRIASPLLGVAYTLQRSRPQAAIALDAAVAADVQNVFWFDGGALIGKLSAGAGALPWRPARDGAHLIRVIDDHGRAAERDVQVQFAW